MHVHILPFALFFLSSSSSSSASPDHLQRTPQEFIELTHPLPPSDHVTPACNLTIIDHSFTDSINKPPFTIPYFPPSDCPHPWSRIILEFHAKSKGQQYSLIAGLWLGGSELLRTSTAEPCKSGDFWKVRKDITRYSSLLVQSNLDVTMMFENIVNNFATGVYHVNVNLLFVKDKAVTVPTPSILSLHNSNANSGFDSDKYYDPPADLIIPVSEDDGDKKGFWFRIESESDSHFKKVKFPRNTYRAILELYVSSHGNDEFWYLNPPNSYIELNNITTGRGNGCYREVFVTIDGRFIASEAPFPVIFTHGVNPLLWEPVVAIGALNLPSYDIDLSPFLGYVLDGKEHKITIGVNDAISYWLVNANLHIWLDHSSSEVEASSAVYHYPNLSLETNEAFKFLDGRFQVAAKRRTVFVGWAKSSLGNLTTRAVRQFRYKNSLRFEKNGDYKLMQQKVKVKRSVETRTERGHLVNRVLIRRRYPLEVATLNLAVLKKKKKNIYVVHTNVSHSFVEQCSIGKIRSSVTNNQVSTGWMEINKDHNSVISGEGLTEQSYGYKDEFGKGNNFTAVFLQRV
ncbi:hypothetical protein Pint_06569 [Pistacia integerrima]|uniref:Uncharacterized protein n=1 Tax=Pistacia integerrima TaxID=434235 RepID=A0ACC0Z661_9ROSI|nr:hypothetical protein Pint_06569 [Pistacia integerrima]